MESRQRHPRLFLLALIGVLAFTLAGLINGLVLVRFELPLGAVIEGAIWGLILGYFIRDQFKLGKVVLAAILANVLSYFIGVAIGFALPIPRFVAYMIMGLIMGLVFGGILGKGKGAFLLGMVGAIVFLIGGFLFDLVATTGTAFYNFVEDVWGSNGWIMVAPTITGMFKGLAMGLGLGLYDRK